MKHPVKRAAAYFIDCLLCYSAIMLIIQWAILGNLRESVGITDAWFESSWHTELYVLTTISLPVWGYFVYFDSYKSKGTFGKRLLKLTLVNQQGLRISIGRSLIRTLLKLAPWEIAHIGVIFPVPLYFMEAPEIRLLTIVGLFFFALWILSILINSEHRSLYDKLLGTHVLEKGKEHKL